MKQMYYSEILNKYFDSEDECVKAEAEHKRAEAAKAEAKALVAKESKGVEEAFKARNAARRTYNEKLIELRKTYDQTVRAAEEAFRTGLKEVREAKDVAEDDYDKKLSEFQKAHPEGYRLCLKDGDNVATITSDPFDYKPASSYFDDMLDLFSNIIQRF